MTADDRRPLTLLNVNNYHYRRGGAESVALDQATLFEAGGWDVVPFAMHHPQNLPSPWSEYWVDEIEFGAEYSLSEKITRSGRVVWSRQAQRRLASLLDRKQPDVAHLHNVYHHISASVIPLLAERGIPTVLTTHDLKLACPSYQMLTHDGVCERCKGGRIHNVVRHRCVKDSLVLSSVVFVESALHRVLKPFDAVDRFVSPSRFYIDKFVEWGFERHRFVHIPNHVDPADFRPDFRPGAEVVFFGRVAPEKGLETLVRASAASGVATTIVGTGPQEASLHALVDRIGAPVTFAGYRSGDELHDIVRSARAIVLPSEWYENGPMSVLEAYALGTPVVGAAIGGIPELIVEGETGLVFQSGSVDDLERALRTIAAQEDPEIEQMGRRARALVEREYTSAIHVRRLLALYEDLGVPVAG